MSPRWIWSDKITNERVARVGYNHFISNKGEWNNCFSKFSNWVLTPIVISTILQSEKFLTWRYLAHYFPYDVKLRLLADSWSFSANQKARNAIVGAENLLKAFILIEWSPLFFWIDRASSCNLSSIVKPFNTISCELPPPPPRHTHTHTPSAGQWSISRLLSKQTVYLTMRVNNEKFPLYSFHPISKIFKYTSECSKGFWRSISKGLLTGELVLKCEVLWMHFFSRKCVLTHQNLHLTRYYQGVAGLEMWRSRIQVPLSATLVNSQLVCLVPVRILTRVMFIYMDCFRWPSKTLLGKWQLRYHYYTSQTYGSNLVTWSRKE